MNIISYYSLIDSKQTRIFQTRRSCTNTLGSYLHKQTFVIPGSFSCLCGAIGSAVNRKVVGSSPPSDGVFSLTLYQLFVIKQYITCGTMNKEYNYMYVRRKPHSRDLNIRIILCCFHFTSTQFVNVAPALILRWTMNIQHVLVYKYWILRR